MTVKRWKQCITIFVLSLILILIALVVFLAVRCGNLQKEHEAAMNVSADNAQEDSAISIDASKLSRFFDSAQQFEYQKKYKNLYIENDFAYKPREEKICYLTFDDGPSTENTKRILDILQEYNVKATFFVVNKEGDEIESLYKRIVKDGHTIGIHSASHDYAKIYKSVEAYLKDFNIISKRIEEVTGVKPDIFRFPGGSVNSYNADIYVPLAAEMLRRGYTYYDWNVSSGDASLTILSKEAICKNVVNGMYDNGENIVLLHDSNEKDSTVEALPEIIETLSAQGYTFAKLDNKVRPIIFNYLS